MIDIQNLKFDEKGLIPAVCQDRTTGEVLMVAYMNRESLEITLEKKLACFYSRSRRCLWLKGETSGNYLHVDSITADCDLDTLVLKVDADGPACHTGADSCFFNPVMEAERGGEFKLDTLYALLKSRKELMPEGSYTTYLFQKGMDKILKKVGEETTEVIVGAKNSREECLYEIADLAYHVMVLMVEMGITPADIREELKGRHVIDKKVKQETMK